MVDFYIANAPDFLAFLTSFSCKLLDKSNKIELFFLPGVSMESNFLFMISNLLGLN